VHVELGQTLLAGVGSLLTSLEGSPHVFLLSDDFHLKPFEQLGLSFELGVQGLELLTLLSDMLVRSPCERHGLTHVVLSMKQACHS
jgi:hypothetical protein